MNINRPKQPDLLRARILNATKHVLLEEGLAALTQERVLARLDISKGGLQHHFRTKQALLDGLFEALFESFAVLYKDALSQEPDGPARHVRAYVRAAACDNERTRSDGRALILLAIGNPKYQQDWAGFLGQMFQADTMESATKIACRLFADGIWFSLVLGPHLGKTEREAAIHKILLLTETIE